MTDENQNELSPGDWNYTDDEEGRKITKLESGIALFCVFLGIVLSFWYIFISVRPGIGLLALVLGLVPMFYLSHIGYIPKEAFGNENQGQSDHSSSELVCPECGWQNPHSNNYCIDCGGELNE